MVQVGAPPSVASFLQRMGRTGVRPGDVCNCLFLATDDEEFLADLAIAILWREGVIEPSPHHLAGAYLRATGHGTLVAGGWHHPIDIDAWIADAAEAVPADVRDMVIRHMLATNILTEDAGIIGFGVRGEREFGRRHFNDLVAAFNSPWLLAVHHGVTDLGSVHPASLIRGSGETSAILLLAAAVGKSPILIGRGGAWLSFHRNVVARHAGSGRPACCHSPSAAPRSGSSPDRATLSISDALPNGW